MEGKKNIFVIIGSASNDSTNEKLIHHISTLTANYFNLDIYRDLKSLPHFDPELSIVAPPVIVVDFRDRVRKADGIIICTPEYVFSIPSGLKNAIEWCISTTIFTDKPTGLITASANGQKGHEELQLIMKTVMAKFNSGTTLLIPGVKAKMNNNEITDSRTKKQVEDFVESFKQIVV